MRQKNNFSYRLENNIKVERTPGIKLTTKIRRFVLKKRSGFLILKKFRLKNIII